MWPARTSLHLEALINNIGENRVLYKDYDENEIEIGIKGSLPLNLIFSVEPLFPNHTYDVSFSSKTIVGKAEEEVIAILLIIIRQKGH